MKYKEIATKLLLNMEDDAGFVIPPLNIGKGIDKAIDGIKSEPVKNVMKVGKLAMEAYNNASPEKQEAIRNAFAARAKTRTQHTANKREANNWTKTKTKHPGGGGMNGSSDRSSGGYGLSISPKPKQISLNTGVKPNTYISDFMEADYGNCVPLSMTAALFQFPVTTTELLYNYFINVIAFELQTKAQINISFNLDLTVFSAANILSAMNSLVQALQVYFYYASILTYHSNPHNRNKGMIYLRTQITPQMIDDLKRLERRLLDTPVPPKLLELLRYLSGTYYSGDAAGSPLIKICPVTPTATMTNANDASFALGLISSTTNNQIYTLMRKCVPQWLPTTLYDVPTVPFYDKGFKTIFANLPFETYIGSVLVQEPQVTSDTGSIFYNTYDDNLDGAAFALTGMWTTATAAWTPGLIIPLTGTTSTSINGNSRWSYYVDSTNTTKQFYPSDDQFTMARSRQETYMMNDSASGIGHVHLSGSSLCQNVTPATVRETCYKVVDYLMSFDQIKVDAKNFYHKSSKGKR